MLELGVLPDVAAATSTTMIAFTSLAACLVYADFGLIQWDYGAALLVLGAVASAAGQLATAQLVRALGRRSVIVFLMVTLVGGARVHGAGRGRAWRWLRPCVQLEGGFLSRVHLWRPRRRRRVARAAHLVSWPLTQPRTPSPQRPSDGARERRRGVQRRRALARRRRGRRRGVLLGKRLRGRAVRQRSARPGVLYRQRPARKGGCAGMQAGPHARPSSQRPCVPIARGSPAVNALTSATLCPPRLKQCSSQSPLHTLRRPTGAPTPPADRRRYTSPTPVSAPGSPDTERRGSPRRRWPDPHLAGPPPACSPAGFMPLPYGLLYNRESGPSVPAPASHPQHPLLASPRCWRPPPIRCPAD
jgi:hypothetical protein